MTIVEFLPQQVFGLLFVFARIGTAMILLPGIGEQFISTRSRLVLAVMLSVVLLPTLIIPDIPTNVVALFLIIAGEVVIGLYIGLSARMILLALETAGTIIGMQTGLANAFVLNPSMAQQAGIVGVFLSITGIALLFATDMHHMAIIALTDSYQVFTASNIVWEDMTQQIARLVSDTFLLAVKLSAPFLIVGIVFNVGMGLLSRLMPQMQIFFVAMPLQIVGGLLMLFAVLGTIMMMFIQYYENHWSQMVGW